MIRCREFIAPIMLSVPEPIATVRYRSLRGPLCSKRNFRLGSLNKARHILHSLVEVEAIKFMMEQRNLTVKNLVPYIGQPNRVYEIFNHKRPLTVAMAWRLHKGLGVPAESLIMQAA